MQSEGRMKTNFKVRKVDGKRPRIRFFRILLFILHSSLFIYLPGCTVGPDYHPPQPAMPARWINPSTQPTTQTSTTTSRPIDVVRWWSSFKDPTLDSLIDRAVQANLDLQQATSRLRQARATRGVVGAALLPEIDADAAYTRSGAGKGNLRSFTGPGGRTFTKNTATRSNLYVAGFDSTWELDLFGGIRRNVESADANIVAAVEDRRDVLVSLIAEVATDYMLLRGFQQQLVISRENLELQQHTAVVTRQKLAAGSVSKLDVANADAQVYSTLSDIPALESSAQQTIYALCLLLAREPEALLAELSPTRQIPLAPPDVPIGLPGELLKRRPDIRRAEAQLHAATAQVGAAAAQLYPQINLLGSLNIETTNLHGLGNWANNLWSIGPSVTWPIFAGGRIVSTIEVQNTLQEQALLTYRKAVLTALQDVENALVAYSKEQQRRDALIQAVAANQQAEKFARQLYNLGQTDFLNVLNAERSLFAAQLALIQSQTSIATDLAALNKALGGGW
jgi:NodT family efflux transporter outer membrane factor (OMF) lipoprotein